MKTRSFMILLGLCVFTSILLWIFNANTSHLRTIVSKTQIQIQNINSKIKDFKDSNDEEKKKYVDEESTYLEHLGFVDNPKLYNINNTNETFVILTAFSRYTEKEKMLIESKMNYFPNETLLIYDIDLSFSEQLKIRKLCNQSCTLKVFKAEKYPKHVKQSKIRSYKPIIIQEVLNEYGQLIYLEPPNFFISNKIETFLNHSSTNGVVLWPSKTPDGLSEPITQMTHPSMFKYFSLKQSDFYFVHMLDTTKMFITNLKEIHTGLMFSWVKCSLKESCISPLGAQFSGCDFNRRPEFLYSGCHRYESSSFSIITSLLFNFDLSKYTMSNVNESVFATSLDLTMSSTSQLLSIHNSFLNESNVSIKKRNKKFKH